jgi:hypothetical protein
MGIVKGIGLLAGLAGAGVVFFAQKRSAETGKDIKEILANLPAELKVAGDEWKQKMNDAAEAGKRAMAEREAEIDRELEQEEARLRNAADVAVAADSL